MPAVTTATHASGDHSHSFIYLCPPAVTVVLRVFKFCDNYSHLNMTYNILPVPKGISICTLYFLHMLAFQKKKENNSWEFRGKFWSAIRGRELQIQGQLVISWWWLVISWWWFWWWIWGIYARRGSWNGSFNGVASVDQDSHLDAFTQGIILEYHWLPQWKTIFGCHSEKLFPFFPLWHASAVLFKQQSIQQVYNSSQTTLGELRLSCTCVSLALQLLPSLLQVSCFAPIWWAPSSSDGWTLTLRQWSLCPQLPPLHLSHQHYCCYKQFHWLYRWAVAGHGQGQGPCREKEKVQLISIPTFC